MSANLRVYVRVCVCERDRECVWVWERDEAEERIRVYNCVLEQLLLNLACVDFLEQKEKLVQMSLRSLHRDRHGCASKRLRVDCSRCPCDAIEAQTAASPASMPLTVPLTSTASGSQQDQHFECVCADDRQ